MRRRRIGIVAALAVAGVVAAGGIALAVTPTAPSPADTPAPPEATATVERGDLVITKDVEGLLAFGSERQLTVRRAGTITWLPAVGTTVHRGESLLRVDDRAVPLFIGETPMYRTLDGSGLSGADVDVVAANLIELGYLAAFPPGDVTGPLFASAVARWRDAVGLPPVALPPDPGQDPGAADADSDADPDADGGDAPDGGTVDTSPPPPARMTMSAIEPGDMIVSSSDVRVASVRAQLGDAALDTVALDVTSTRKTVVLDAAAAQEAPLAVGATVVIVLPGGGETAGTVQSVGSAGSAGTDSGAPAAAPAVVIDVADQAALDGVDGGPLIVRTTSDRREGVLTVPVSALLALREGGYALQRVDGTLVPVATGLFTEQQVEVSGEDVAEGLVVVDAT